MADVAAVSDFRFLYRQTEGVIDRATWARASVGPVAVALALTAVAWAIAPDTPRDLATQAFIDPTMIAIHVYYIAYAFALMLCAVAEYFVSAKRFADRGKPGGFRRLRAVHAAARRARIGFSRDRKARCRDG